jgi:hypothetical protein
VTQDGFLFLLAHLEGLDGHTATQSRVAVFADFAHLAVTDKGQAY